MATRLFTPTPRYQSSSYGKDVIVVWNGLLNGDDGTTNLTVTMYFIAG